MDREPARLLAAHSELGYTDDPSKAMTDEPEAVPSEYQRYLTRDAERRRKAQQLIVWDGCHHRILQELATLTDTAFDVDVSGDVRSIRRTLERADHRLRLGL